MRNAIVAIALALSLAPPVAAQTLPELSYGAAITSNYISKGVSQSNDNPAVQGYVEGTYGAVYAGVWSSTVDLSEDGTHDQVEFDLYAGVRPPLGDLFLDFSYYRYLYNDSGDCCGEFILALGYPMADVGEVGAELDYDPTNDLTWGELSVSVGAPADFDIGGTIGTDFGTYDLGSGNKVAWDLGVTRALGDTIIVDLRYYESNYESGRGVLTLSVDY